MPSISGKKCVTKYKGSLMYYTLTGITLKVAVRTGVYRANHSSRVLQFVMRNNERRKKQWKKLRASYDGDSV